MTLLNQAQPCLVGYFAFCQNQHNGIPSKYKQISSRTSLASVILAKIVQSSLILFPSKSLKQLFYTFINLNKYYSQFPLHSQLPQFSLIFQVFTPTLKFASPSTVQQVPAFSHLQIKPSTVIYYSYIKFKMGQCSLSDQQLNGCADFFGSADTEDGSCMCTEKDRQLWDNELNISAISQLPEPSFWQENTSLTHSCFPQIAKDVNRTFPDCPYFGNKTNIVKFQKVLKKLALYFPQVGYTQGLNFAAGFLLLSGCEEEQCFRLMSKLMLHERILGVGLYEDNFPLVQLYCEVFWQLLEKKMPKVHGILKRSYITDDLWLFQWFISLFLYNFPVQFAKRLWDFVICKKEMAVVLIALGIINSLKKELVEIEFQDEIDFLDFVNQFKRIQFCRQFLDLKKIISFANSITKSQIDRAISQTKCHDNPYRLYFSSSPSHQKQLWAALIKKLQAERSSFAQNTEPVRFEIKYERTDVFDNLEKLILTKYKLYQSSELRGSNFYKRSNISTPMSFKSAKSKYGQGFGQDNKHL